MKSDKILEPYKAVEELPLVLSAIDIQRATGIKETKVYELMNSHVFPSFRIGKRICVKKQDFLKWLDNQGKK